VRDGSGKIHIAGMGPIAETGLRRKGGMPMNMLMKGLSGFFILTFLGLNLPTSGFCEDSLLFARAGQKHITRHEPRIMTTPEKEIPMVQPEAKEKKGRTKYLWLGLGAAVVLGVVAAGAGGGGGGGDTPAAEGSGNISVGW
jgi:hypothetical protein